MMPMMMFAPTMGTGMEWSATDNMYNMPGTATMWPMQMVMVQPGMQQQQQMQPQYNSMHAGAGVRQQQLMRRQMEVLQELQELQQGQQQSKQRIVRERRPGVASTVPMPPLALQRLQQWSEQSPLQEKGELVEGTATPESSDKNIETIDSLPACETIDSLPSMFFPPTPERTPSNSPRYGGVSTLDSLPSMASFVVRLPAQKEVPMACPPSVVQGMSAPLTMPPPPPPARLAQVEATGAAPDAACEALLRRLAASEHDGPAREEAMATIRETAWWLASSPAGCRVVQHALSIGTFEEKAALTEQLRGNVLEASACPNANHVLQKCVQDSPDESVQFIIEELSGQVATVSRHRYGCRVLERLIERGWHTESLVDEVLADASQLCRHPFGNFVVQHVLKLGTALQRRSVVEILHTDIQRLARHRVASHVVRCALANGSVEDRHRLVSALTADPANCADLANHHCGSYVVREMRKERRH